MKSSVVGRGVGVVSVNLFRCCCWVEVCVCGWPESHLSMNVGVRCWTFGAYACIGDGAIFSSDSHSLISVRGFGRCNLCPWLLRLRIRGLVGMQMYFSCVSAYWVYGTCCFHVLLFLLQTL